MPARHYVKSTMWKTTGSSEPIVPHPSEQGAMPKVSQARRVRTCAHAGILQSQFAQGGSRCPYPDHCLGSRRQYRIRAPHRDDGRCEGRWRQLLGYDRAHRERFRLNRTGRGRAPSLPRPDTSPKTDHRIHFLLAVPAAVIAPGALRERQWRRRRQARYKPRGQSTPRPGGLIWFGRFRISTQEPVPAGPGPFPPQRRCAAPRTSCGHATWP